MPISAYKLKALVAFLSTYIILDMQLHIVITRPSRACEGIEARPLVTDGDPAVTEVIALVVIAIGC